MYSAGFNWVVLSVIRSLLFLKRCYVETTVWKVSCLFEKKLTEIINEIKYWIYKLKNVQNLILTLVFE